MGASGHHDDHGDSHGHGGHHGGGSGLGTLVVAAVIAVAAFFGGRMVTGQPPIEPPRAEAAPAEGGAVTTPAKGASDPLVVVIESADFQCPFCARVQPTIQRLLRDYPGLVQVRYRHNPLPFHPSARPAALASMAAHAQGKFWEMAELLYENQRELTDEKFLELAEELKLDIDQFKRDLDNPSIAAKIDADAAAMTALGALGTPNFFVNGVQVKGAQSFDVFKRIIDDQLQQAGALVKAGATPAEAYVTLARKNAKDPAAFVDYGILEEEAPGLGAAEPGGAPAAPKQVADETVYKVTVDKDDAQKGSPDALVTIVLFSEFQCPFCSRVAPTIKKIEEIYGDKVRVVFKHNPLPFHDNAMPASEAALAAQEQGKFWEMHDKLFANQQKLDAASLDGYARDLGLDMVKFKAAMDTHKFKKNIAADQALAEKVTARGTPNSFINGRKVTGARPFEDFKAVIDEELDKAEKLVEAGTPRTSLYATLISSGKTFSELSDDVKTIKTDGAPILGTADAPVKIAVFSDFQCPYCSRVGPPLEEVKKHYGDKVAVVFKHFPLSFHQNAMPAAEAAEAAGEQGKFWEMHDKLFANQKALSRDDLEKYAAELGLDMAKFKASLDSHRNQQKIKDSLAEGQTVGVRGTPSLYINGRAFQPGSGYTLDAFRRVIDTQLN